MINPSIPLATMQFRVPLQFISVVFMFLWPVLADPRWTENPLESYSPLTNTRSSIFFERVWGWITGDTSSITIIHWPWRTSHWQHCLKKWCRRFTLQLLTTPIIFSNDFLVDFLVVLDFFFVVSLMEAYLEYFSLPLLFTVKMGRKRNSQFVEALSSLSNWSTPHLISARFSSRFFWALWTPNGGHNLWEISQLVSGKCVALWGFERSFASTPRLISAKLWPFLCGALHRISVKTG